MKCYYKEGDPFTSASTYYHLNITMEPEDMQEAFELGLLALGLRRHEVWCVFDSAKPSLTMQVRGENG